jgi:hypothetical protein
MFLLFGLMFGVALGLSLSTTLNGTTAVPSKPLLRDLEKIRKEDGWVMPTLGWDELVASERCDTVFRPTRLPRPQRADEIAIGREEGWVLCREWQGGKIEP